MDIQVKFDYKGALKEYNKVVKSLQELTRYKAVIKIDDKKVYEKTGVKVEAVAFYMEYGRDELNVHYPARPFWRNTLIKYEEKIQNRFKFNINSVLKGKKTPYECYEDLGKQFKQYLIATMKEGNFIPLAESTLKAKEKKGTGSSPLIDTKLLINSIVYEVVAI